jgi:hypothetical protein
VGTFLNHVFLPNEYVLQVVKQPHAIEHTTKQRVVDTSRTTTYHPAQLKATGTQTVVTTSTATHHSSSDEVPTTATTTDEFLSHPRHWYSF